MDSSFRLILKEKTKTTVCMLIILGLLIIGATSCNKQTESNPPMKVQAAYKGWQIYDHGDFHLSYPSGWNADTYSRLIDRYHENIVSMVNSRNPIVTENIFKKSQVAIRSGGAIAATLPKDGVYVEIQRIDDPGRTLAPGVGQIYFERDSNYEASIEELKSHVRPGKPRQDFEKNTLHISKQRAWSRLWLKFSTNQAHYLAQIVLADNAKKTKTSLAKDILTSIRVDTSSENNSQE